MHAEVFGPLTSAPLASGLDVGPEPAQRLSWDIARRSGIDQPIEAEVAKARHQETALRRGRGVDQRSLCRIGEKGGGDFMATGAVDVRAVIAGAGPLRVIGPFEFMVARGLAKEFVGGRRVVEYRRPVDADNLLFGVKVISRAELEPCEALAIDADEVQPIVRDLDGDALHRMSIPAGEQRRLPTLFG